jgi:hypothetical protein
MRQGAIKIAPSILAANLARLGEQVAEGFRCRARGGGMHEAATNPANAAVIETQK